MGSDARSLCTGLVSPDKDTRVRAEAVLADLKENNLYQLLGGLMELLHQPFTSSDASARQSRDMACVLLRQLFNPKSCPRAARDLKPEVFSSVKQGLIEAAKVEAMAGLVNIKLCHCIAQAAAWRHGDADSGGGGHSTWPELLDLMGQLMSSNVPSQRQMGFSLLDKVVEYRRDLILPFAAQLPEPLFKGLQDDQDGTVRVMALKAACSVAMEMATVHGSDAPQALLPLLPAMLHALERTLVGQHEAVDEDAARSCMSAMTLLTEQAPKFMKESVDAVGQLVVAIVGSAALETATRTIALEWFITLAEKSPGRVRKAPWLQTSLLPLILQLTMLVPEDGDTPEGLAKWASRADLTDSFADLNDDDDDNSQLIEAGAMALDRLGRALGGKTVYRPMTPLLEDALKDSNSWSKRRGALVAIAMMAEGCRAQLSQHLPQVMPFLVNYALDPHPRVRYALLSCVTQLAEDLAQEEEGTNGLMTFHTRYGQLLLPAFAASLGEVNQAFPRVLGAAAGAVSCFCRPDKLPSAEALQGQLQPLLESLFNLLGTAPIFVKEEAMTAIATLAQVARDAFAPYYSTFVPLAKNLVAAWSQDPEGELEVLGMRALEAFALIGDAVGRDLFRPDAHEVLQAVTSWQRLDQVSKGDAELSYMISSTARIGCALGSEFAPYLPKVLPLVLEAASTKPQYKVRTANGTEQSATGEDDDDEPDDDEQVMGIELRGAGNFEVRVKSWQVQQREVACEALLRYVTDMLSLLTPYLSAIITVVLDLLNITATQGVRTCAYGMLPRLLRAASRQKTNPNPLLAQEALEQTLTRLVKLLKHEDAQLEGGNDDALETLCVGADALMSSLKMAHQSTTRLGWTSVSIQEKTVLAVYELLRDLMLHSINRRLSLQAEVAEGGDDDEDAIADAVEWEQDLMSSIQEGHGALVRCIGEAVVPVFQAMMEPVVLPLLDQRNGLELRLFALCLYLEVVEFGGRLGASRAHTVVPTVLQYLKDEDEDARSTAAYAVGVLAQFGGDAFPPALVAQALSELVDLIVNAVEGDDNIVKDNAVSSVLRLCRYRAGSCDAPRMLSMALTQWLPLKEDLQEAHASHAFLIEWLESETTTLMGATGEELPNILRLLAALMDDHRTPDEQREGLKDGDQEEAEDDMWEMQLVAKETRLRIENLLRSLQERYPDQASRAWQAVSETERSALQRPTSSIVRLS